MGREPFSSWSTWKRGATIKERRRTEESLSVVPIGVLPEEFRQRRYIPENRTQAKVKGSENSHEGDGEVLSGTPGASSHTGCRLHSRKTICTKAARQCWSKQQAGTSA